MPRWSRQLIGNSICYLVEDCSVFDVDIRAHVGVCDCVCEHPHERALHDHVSVCTWFACGHSSEILLTWDMRILNAKGKIK